MSCMQPVLNKPSFYRRWKSGEFGNKPLTWPTLNDALQSSWNGLFVVRYTLPGSQWMKYGVSRNDLEATVNSFIADGAIASNFEFNTQQPDNLLKLQGEVQRDHRGLCLHYSREKIPMRPALTRGKQVYGLSAEMLLKWSCDPSSVDDIKLILDELPEHVVEFSAYDCMVGSIPNRNTLIWEVRRY